MLKVESLIKEFRTPHGVVRALDDVSFELAAGETLSLVGPSGCGKTTCLRSIAGLENPDTGRISIDGQVVFDGGGSAKVPPNRRPIAMVFQSYAIWPHMTVFENVVYPLRVGGPRLSKSELHTRVADVLELMRIPELMHREATALSGGQQQRVAVARALIRRPKLLLLDEPLSNLDAKLREEMRFEFREIFTRSGVTAVYVTHDLGEAFVLSTRVSVMQRGHIVQSATPRDLYFRPEHPFVAEFMGGNNLIHGTVRAVKPGGPGQVDFGNGVISCLLPEGLMPGAAVLLAIRPSDLALSASAGAPAPDKIAVRGRVTMAAFVGGAIEYRVQIGDGTQQLRAHASSLAAGPQFDEQSEVWVIIDGSACTAIPGQASSG
jgi:iron(III) transport system ATP-binding protein